MIEIEDFLLELAIEKGWTSDDAKTQATRWRQIVKDRSHATDEDNSLILEVARLLKLGHNYLAAAEEIHSALMGIIPDALRDREWELRYETDPNFAAQVDKSRARLAAIATAAEHLKFLSEAKRVLIPGVKSFNPSAAIKLLNRVSRDVTSPHRGEALELLRKIPKLRKEPP